MIDFQDDAFSPVNIDVGPDGSLYYLSIGSGAVYRVQFAEPPENASPAAQVLASFTSGTPLLEVTFDGSGSTDPEQDNLAYSLVFLQNWLLLLQFGESIVHLVPVR